MVLYGLMWIDAGFSYGFHAYQWYMNGLFPWAAPGTIDSASGSATPFRTMKPGDAT
jgi:hypothetical protein